MHVRELEYSDRPWAEALVCEYFVTPHVVSRGVLHDTRSLPEFGVEGTPIEDEIEFERRL